MQSSSKTSFDAQYQRLLQHLTLKGLQPKTIDAYSRAIRRVGAFFDHQIDDPKSLSYPAPSKPKTCAGVSGARYCGCDSIILSTM